MDTVVPDRCGERCGASREVWGKASETVVPAVFRIDMNMGQVVRLLNVYLCECLLLLVELPHLLLAHQR